MATEIPYIQIAPIASGLIQFVSNYTITGENKRPLKLVLNIAMDSKGDTEQIELPVFIPAMGNYPSCEVDTMYSDFKSGAPFVAVKMYGLKVYRNEEGEKIKYYGFADSFEVVNDPASYIEEELLI